MAARDGIVVGGRDVRLAGGAMLGAALALPALPFEAGIPCPLRSATGIPCPLCGMTTSVVATVHGDLGAALAANPAGVAAVAVAVWVLVARTRDVRVPLPAALAGVAGTWAFELFRFL